MFLCYWNVTFHITCILFAYGTFPGITGIQIQCMYAWSSVDHDDRYILEPGFDSPLRKDSTERAYHVRGTLRLPFNLLAFTAKYCYHTNSLKHQGIMCEEVINIVMRVEQNLRSEILPPTNQKSRHLRNLKSDIISLEKSKIRDINPPPPPPM